MLTAIQAKILNGEYEFSQHATNQAIKRRIVSREVKESILQGEIIETYPDDKYGASCLIFGYTQNRRPLHIVCSYPARDLLKIITLYEPDLNQWINYRKRRLN
jgi:hypothetical protein